MKRPLSLLMGAMILVAAPAGAQMMSGMSSMSGMQYYVGTWSCMAGNVGQPQSKATATFTMESGLLRQYVVVPAQGKMKNAYTLEIVTAFDAKKHRYVQTGLGNDAGWWVAAAQPWTGNTETWMDVSNAAGKLGRGVTVRTNQNTYAFMSYPSPTSMKVVFKGSCTRST